MDQITTKTTDIESLIRKYLGQVQVMQLATVADNQPWACNVHFAADDNLNLYWLSQPNRRHSQEIAKNKNVAATVAIKFPENPVIGVSVEGEAEVVLTPEAVEVFDGKFNLNGDFKKKLLEGAADEKLYRLKPRLFVLFDQVKFPDRPRIEWKPAGNT